MSFDTVPILDKIRIHCGSSVLWVAYSGGMDSHVLLHLLAQYRHLFPQGIQVVHVDHQLQAVSSEWAEHCRQVTQSLQLPFHCLKVTVEHIAHNGLEAAARTARYQAIKRLINGNGVLLTGQHLQDQAETLMLQLLRGAGSRGLGAMKDVSHWQQLPIVRPLLSVSRDMLLEYATLHQLNWIDDPSNQDMTIQRNFLRHQVWPVLRQRWPALNRNLARSALNIQESQKLLDELAQQDYEQLNVNMGEGSLPIDQLLTLSAERQRNLLRFFIAKQNMALPSRQNLQRILDEVCEAAEDAQPEVRWHHYIARRYRNRLFLDTVSSSTRRPDGLTIYEPQPVLLDEQRQLVWHEQQGEGIRQEMFDQGMSVRYRQGGETIQLAGKTHHQSLKKLFQQWQIPVWERDTIPLLYANGELVAIVGYGCAESAKPYSGHSGWQPRITPISQGDFD